MNPVRDNTKLDEHQAKLLELCKELTDHVALLRDYGTTPGNVWLARGELHQVSRLTAEIEQLLSELQESTES